LFQNKKNVGILPEISGLSPSLHPITGLDSHRKRLFEMPFNNVKNLKAGIRQCGLILLVAGSGLAGGCDTTPTLAGFDQDRWRADERSCGNIRPGLLPQLDRVSGELVGLGHSQVIRILGKPEGKSMEKSGQREYYYYVEAGPQCQDKTRFTDANKLVIRFDILDRVNLVTYRK
jgi:hypothetical protein